MQNECTSTRMRRTAVAKISLHTRLSETLTENIVSGSGHFSKKLRENLVSGRPALLSKKFKALQFSLHVQKHDKMIIWLLTAITCVSRDFWQFIFINQNRQSLLSESCLGKFTGAHWFLFQILRRRNVITQVSQLELIKRGWYSLGNVVLQGSLSYLEEPQVTFRAPSGAQLVWIQGVSSSGDGAVLTQSALSPPLSTVH